MTASRKNPKALPDFSSAGYPSFLKELLIEAFSLYSFFESSQDSDYTMLGQTGHELVIFTGSTAQVGKTPANPIPGQRYSFVREGTGAVTVNGNTRNINGSGTASLASQGDTLSLVYSAESDEYKTI